VNPAVTLPVLLAAQSAPLALPDDPPEIVVVAERLQRLTVNVVQDREGRWHCSLGASSGVERLDRRLCTEVTRCVQKGAASEAAVTACIGGEKARLLRHFRREWRENHG
jgi:hypothetical protein